MAGNGEKKAGKSGGRREAGEVGIIAAGMKLAAVVRIMPEIRSIAAYLGRLVVSGQIA